MVVTPTSETLVAKGDAVELAELSGELPNYQLLGAFWQSRRTWVEANPETSASFCTAMGKAYDYMNDPANAEAVNKLILDAVGKDVPDDAVDRIRENFSVLDEAISQEDFQRTVDALTAVNVLQPTPAVTYDQAILIK
jgi:ABC-type nitrate/sulfonate/bicarbonate transport system substrate-binding protein